jgi:hypothetical protein
MSMKQTYILGEHESTNQRTYKKVLGDLIVEVSAIGADEPRGTSLVTDHTVNELIRQSGKTAETFYNPINDQYFTLDLTPWVKDYGNKYLSLDMIWVRKQ